MVKRAPEPLGATSSALADPTRRAIVVRLSDRGTSAEELAEQLAIPLPAISYHLTVLEQAGLLVRQGRTAPPL